MLELISDLPDNVVGVRASGWVGAEDYSKVLTPATEAAISRHGKVRVLYEIGPDFLGYTPGAMWDDMRLGLSHMRAWERIAVVTDNDWIAGAMRMFLFAMPFPSKVFKLAEMPQALEWIVAD